MIFLALASRTARAAGGLGGLNSVRVYSRGVHRNELLLYYRL